MSDAPLTDAEEYALEKFEDAVGYGCATAEAADRMTATRAEAVRQIRIAERKRVLTEVKEKISLAGSEKVAGLDVFTRIDGITAALGVISAMLNIENSINE